MQLVYGTPAEDAHRLVYADWLTEHGDPRGEFIALQFRREAEDRARGRRHHWDRLAPLTEVTGKRARERLLQDSHGPGWLGELRPVIDHESMVFHKGFLAACEVSFASEEQRGALQGASEWATVQRLAADARMLVQPSLQSLWSVGPVAPHAISGLRRLHPLPHVTEVRLIVSEWTSRLRTDVFWAMPALEQLALLYPDSYTASWSDFQPTTFAALLDHNSAPTLTSLHIRKRVLMSYPRWRDFTESRPDLRAWVGHCRNVDNGVRAIRLDPCHGWNFTLERRPDGAWALRIDWHTMSASADPKTLELALARVGRTDFAHIKAYIHGYVRPHHRHLLKRLLARYRPVTIGVAEDVASDS